MCYVSWKSSPNINSEKRKLNAVKTSQTVTATVALQNTTINIPATVLVLLLFRLLTEYYAYGCYRLFLCCRTRAAVDTVVTDRTIAAATPLSTTVSAILSVCVCIEKCMYTRRFCTTYKLVCKCMHT